MPDPKEPAALPALPAPSFPAIEALVEFATPEEITALFAPVSEAVTQLKGPRAEQGKRALKAVAHTTALLAHLLQVREKIESSKKSGGR